jgi:hypothetical protein
VERTAAALTQSYRASVAALHLTHLIEAHPRA